MEYKNSGTIDKEFEVDFTGFAAEHALMNEDEVKKKNLGKFEI
jgi:hypothetical protein